MVLHKVYQIFLKRCIYPNAGRLWMGTRVLTKEVNWITKYPPIFVCNFLKFNFKCKTLLNSFGRMIFFFQFCLQIVDSLWLIIQTRADATVFCSSRLGNDGLYYLLNIFAALSPGACPCMSMLWWPSLRGPHFPPLHVGLVFVTLCPMHTETEQKSYSLIFAPSRWRMVWHVPGRGGAWGSFFHRILPVKGHTDPRSNWSIDNKCCD